MLRNAADLKTLPDGDSDGVAPFEQQGLRNEVWLITLVRDCRLVDAVVVVGVELMVPEPRVRIADDPGTQHAPGVRLAERRIGVTH